jgi:hypothetical protein
MAKRTISFENYEEPGWEEYTGEDPPVGKWFVGKAARAKYLEEDDQVQIIFEITEGDYAGWGRSLYLPLDESDSVYWKTQSTIKALQGGVAKAVTVDFENQKSLDLWLSKMKPVKMKIGEYKERIRLEKVAPMLEAVPTGKKATGAKLAEAEEPDEVDEGDIEDYTEEELGEMEVSELEEILEKEFDLPKDDEDFPEKGAGRGAAAKYKKALIEAILAEQEGDEGDEEDDEEGDDFEDGFEEDPEPEPEPEPAKPARRSRAAKAAPAKAAPPAKAAASTRRRRG